MKKVKRYKYLGRNGILSTRIQLQDVEGIPMYELYAEENMILTDGERRKESVIVYIEDLEKWEEVPKSPEELKQDVIDK
jgi:hypothetical protein